MKDEPRLFVWEDTLCDRTCGIMFALARTADEARLLIVYKDSNAPVEEYVEWREWWDSADQEERGSHRCPHWTWTELETEPRVVEWLEGFIVRGGS